MVLGSAAPARGQAKPTLLEQYTAPITLYKTGLGTFTRPISSASKEAQAFFDQGFQMMYAFAKPEAVRSFREAWKRDPDCAVCYWGEALAPLPFAARHWLGVALLEAQRYQDAERSYR